MQNTDIGRIKREQQFHDEKIGTECVRKDQFKYYSDLKSRNIYKQNLIGEVKGKVVLDYGCGAGWQTIELLKAGAIVRSIDISPVLIAKLNEEVDKLGLSDKCKVYVMDAHKLEFEDDFFDLIIGNGVLHHLNIEFACAEIKRVLKDGGKAVFLEPLGMNPLLNLYRRFTPESRSADETPLTDKELNLIKSLFPGNTLRFFELTTMVSVFFTALRLQGFARLTRPWFESIDKLLLKNSFAQKMAWQVVMGLNK